MFKRTHLAACGLVLALMATLSPADQPPDMFAGRFYRGTGDVAYLELLDTARRMFRPDPQFQSLPMLYAPEWNGLSEGPRWNMWWIQNSYGFVYCALPFLDEPLTTFLENSNALWFDQMGNNERRDHWGHVGPDGVLCDAAAPGRVYYKQGDGQLKMHDWCMGFTAAGLLMQSELLLISRDPKKIAADLPRLERVAEFIDSRRDPNNNLMLAGPAANLLAPSYAGHRKPDGSFGKAYLAELSVTYIAALDRLIEVERLAGRDDRAKLYSDRRDAVRSGLPQLLTEDGYFVRSIDPDGTRHGVYGAAKHGYFESSVNHDAICFGVVDEAAAERIYARIASISELRPHAFIIPNYPGYDDMYEKPEGIWEFGRWVNGGHWSTCEARMIMGYYRLGKHEDARRSMKQLLTFAYTFRMDNPLTRFGSEVWFTDDPIHLCVDNFGPPAAMIRGLFQYRYSAESLSITPCIPTGIRSLSQRFPIRFGTKHLFLSICGDGPIAAVRMNDQPWQSFDDRSVQLPYKSLPESARILILRGEAAKAGVPDGLEETIAAPASSPFTDEEPELAAQVGKLHAWLAQLAGLDLGESREAAHARLALEMTAALHQRRELLAEGKIAALPDRAREAADRSYVEAAARLYTGLVNSLDRLARTGDQSHRRLLESARKVKLFSIWVNVRSEGQQQKFLPREGGRRMTLSGKEDTSCGWSYALPEPLLVPSGGRLMVDISGSSGAKFFVDLLTPDGAVAFQTGWIVAPTVREPLTFDLPGGIIIEKVVLYTMTPGGEVHNDFHRVTVLESPLDLR